MTLSLSSLKAALAILLAIAALLVVVVAGLIHAGVYNVSALHQHFPPTFKVMEWARIRSIVRRSAYVVPPDLTLPKYQSNGMALYEQHCRQCHGAPGIAPDAFALGMKPEPTAIAQIAYEKRDKPGEVYWILSNGIKMTGMPAWQYRLSEEELWQLVRFITKIPDLTPRHYRELLASRKREVGLVSQSSELSSKMSSEVSQSRKNVSLPEGFKPSPEQGKIAIQQYGCSSCHRIAGISSAHNTVGPSLVNIESRSFIAGTLPNVPGNMIRWLRHPHAVDPDNVMPDLGVTERDAWDIYAYLQKQSQ